MSTEVITRVKGIVITENGAADVLRLGEFDLKPPGVGEARAKIHAAGVNFIDVYQRTGRYQVTLPYTPGREAAGIVEAVGQSVTEVKPGDRVDTRSALRAALAERGETLPQLGVSPGFKDMRWPHPVHEGDIVSYSVETVSKRETSKPRWGLVTNTFRAVNQRGEEVLVFSSAVLIAKRAEDT